MKTPLKGSSKTGRCSSHTDEVTETMYTQAIQVMVSSPLCPTVSTEATRAEPDDPTALALQGPMGLRYS